MKTSASSVLCRAAHFLIEKSCCGGAEELPSVLSGQPPSSGATL
jgi:hypothetical protein